MPGAVQWWLPERRLLHHLSRDQMQRLRELSWWIRLLRHLYERLLRDDHPLSPSARVLDDVYGRLRKRHRQVRLGSV